MNDTIRKTTKIQWTDHTVNLWWGCDKISPACANCYAADIDKRFGRDRDFGNLHWGEGVPRLDQRALAETKLAIIHRRAVKRGTTPKVFLNSMSDWLDEEVPIEWLADLLATIEKYPSCIYQMLTKRPENFTPRMEAVADLSHPAAMIASEWLLGMVAANWWIGVTAEDQERADQRIPLLLRIPAKIHFLSCEPLLGPINLTGELGGIQWIGGQRGCNSLHRGVGTDECPAGLHHHHDARCKKGIDWIITGGESGTRSRPTHPFWLTDLRDQAAAAGVPFFFKQWGSWIAARFDGHESRVLCDLAKPGESIGLIFSSRRDSPHLKLWESPPGKDWHIASARVGTEAAGAVLDARVWNEFPADLPKVETFKKRI